MIFQPLLIRDHPYFIDITKIGPYPAHIHSEVEMLYCLEGEMNIILQGEPYCLRANELVLVEKLVAHEIVGGSGRRMAIQVGSLFLGEQYKQFKQQFSESVIDFVSQHYPYLRQSIDRVYTATPLTYRDYTATPEGSAYGMVKDCRNPMITLLPARTRIGNLLITGQSLNIHGCLGTVVSSAVTCSEILGVEYLSKKIGDA
jgi:hypothetical protein